MERLGLADAIRAVSRGVIGISVLQALFAGIGLVMPGIPQASLITFGVLIFGIVQIGPSITLIHVVIWAWTIMDTPPAILFTAYMVPVNLLDNFLRADRDGSGIEDAGARDSGRCDRRHPCLRDHRPFPWTDRVGTDRVGTDRVGGRLGIVCFLDRGKRSQFTSLFRTE
jgi:hypothetical protein